MSANHPVGLNQEDLNKITTDIESKCSKYLDDLIKQSGVNLEENKKLSTEYNECLNNISNLEHEFTKLNWFVIFILVVLSIVTLGIGFLFLLVYLRNKQKQKNSLQNLSKIKRDDIGSAKKQEIYDKLIEAKKEESEILKKLESNLAPFLSIFSVNNLCENVWTSSFDGCSINKWIYPEYFSVWNDLPEKFELYDYESFLNVATMDIYDHPSILFETRKQLWGLAVYTETTTASWTDSEGNTHTETLVAEVEYPCPYYVHGPVLAFKTNFNPLLKFNNEIIFQRKHSFFGKKNKDTKGGPAMDNPEFDNKYLFYRNNENSFRALFTILTQEKYINLTNDVGQFKLWKNGQYTFVSDDEYTPNAERNLKFRPIVKHLFNDETKPYLRWDALAPGMNGIYDLDEFKKYKAKSIKNFACSCGLIKMPILNLPVYMNEKYIEKSKKNKNISSIIQSEALANTLFAKLQPLGKLSTPVIIKTYQKQHLVKNGLDIYISKVYINYFTTRLIYIPAMAHGAHRSKMVDVPVTQYNAAHQIMNLIEIHGLNKNKDCPYINNNYVLESGVYGRLSKSPITQDNIDLALELVKPFMNINNKNHPYSALKKLERKL